MAFIQKLLGSTAAVVALGSAVVACDVKHRQVYPCQPFQDALKQYIHMNCWRFLGYLYQKKLEVASRDICKSQEEFLLAQLRENCCTEYGNLYNFKNMRNICDFRRCHPITRYEHYKPYIERMMNGESNVLTRTSPILFATTAGTSGEKKAIPVVQRQSDIFYLEGVGPAINCITQCLNCENRNKLYKEFNIFHNPCWKMTNAGIKWFLAQLACKWVGLNNAEALTTGIYSLTHADDIRKLLYMFTTPHPVIGLYEEPEALYIHLLFGLHDCQVAMMQAEFASTILYAFKTLEFERPKLMKDLTNGTINPKLDLRCDIRLCLERMSRGNCERAKVVQQAFECGSDGLGVRLWPHLQVVVSIDTGPFSFYGDVLRESYLKGVNLYSPLYTSAEGLLGVNIWPKNLPTRYILHPRAMFFELIPLANVQEEQPDTVLLNQAEAGEMYEVVITNASGLYRYRMSDIIRVCGFHHEAPIIEFMYRESQKLNISNEEMTEYTLYEAVTEAVKEWEGFKLMDYVAVPSNIAKTIVHNSKDPKIKDKYMMERTCYMLFLEPNAAFTNPTQEQIEILERHLSERCPAYGELRENGTLGEVFVTLVSPGSFMQLRDFWNHAHHTASNQYKTLRILNDSDAIEFIMKKGI